MVFACRHSSSYLKLALVFACTEGTAKSDHHKQWRVALWQLMRRVQHGEFDGTPSGALLVGTGLFVGTGLGDGLVVGTGLGVRLLVGTGLGHGLLEGVGTKAVVVVVLPEAVGG